MKKTITVEGPVKVGDLILFVVVKSLLNGRFGKKSAWLFGLKSPVAMVIKSGSSRRVFRIDGEEISIEQLLEENPDIDSEINIWN